MYPILLELGPVTIYSLWIFVAIGFFAALLIINKLSQKTRLRLKFLADNSLAIFFAGLIVARLFYVARNSALFLTDLNLESFLQIFYIWDKGLSPWGAVAGILAAVAYFAKKEGENIFKWLDVMAVSILGGMAFSNAGAFLDGRNFGRETDLPWGVVVENSLYAVPIHPTQLYAALYTAILAGVLFELFNHKISKEPGNISLLAMTGYAFLRFIEEFLRGDESNLILNLREGFIYALLGILVGGMLLYVRFKKPHGND
ncbi:MAG TPA: prolipoprotein diacylglyceryl transferase family protein [Candidatus Gracilibacteria bacterium]|nr:prolipoprotein diacylglyceryl transferase family protein [Candidatus Gracilibacteria bacterium]